MNDDLHARIKNIMIDVMAVLYENNIRQVHMGAMLRLLGVTDSAAQAHDDEIIELDENFGELLSQLNKHTEPVQVPKGTIFH